MKKLIMLAMVVAFVLALAVPFTVQAGSEDACYGLVSAAYAEAGLQGEHASSFAGEPRIGIANLASLLYDAGVISEDSMTGLGQWLNAELGLGIEACEY